MSGREGRGGDGRGGEGSEGSEGRGGRGEREGEGRGGEGRGGGGGGGGGRGGVCKSLISTTKHATQYTYTLHAYNNKCDLNAFRMVHSHSSTIQHIIHTHLTHYTCTTHTNASLTKLYSFASAINVHVYNIVCERNVIILHFLHACNLDYNTLSVSIYMYICMYICMYTEGTYFGGFHLLFSTSSEGAYFGGI